MFIQENKIKESWEMICFISSEVSCRLFRETNIKDKNIKGDKSPEYWNSPKFLGREAMVVAVAERHKRENVVIYRNKNTLCERIKFAFNKTEMKGKMMTSDTTKHYFLVIIACC